jgi:hypothetical protein
MRIVGTFCAPVKFKHKQILNSHKQPVWWVEDVLAINCLNKQEAIAGAMAGLSVEANAEEKRAVSLHARILVNTARHREVDDLA